MADALTLEQLQLRRKVVVKKLEKMAREHAPISEFTKAEKYLKLLDKRIERATTSQSAEQTDPITQGSL